MPRNIKTSVTGLAELKVRGIKGMVEKDAYCIDNLNQVSAAQSALNSFT